MCIPLCAHLPLLLLLFCLLIRQTSESATPAVVKPQRYHRPAQVETAGKLGGPGSVAVFEYPERRARERFQTSKSILAVLTRLAMRAMWAMIGFGHEPMKFGGWDSTRVSEGVVSHTPRCRNSGR